MKSPKKITYILLILVGIFYSESVIAQTFVPYTQRLENGGLNIKGDITFIANSIVSKNQDGTVPNDDYNGSESNNRTNLDYIDIDNDPTTFSSSKAQLNIPDCSKVVFAGLYWSAVYPRKFWDDVNSTRDVDVNTIKFQLPNQSYQDVTGEVIFDGETIPGTDEKIVYTVFSDVTSIIAAQTNPNGDYIAANIKATVRGTSNTGSSAGWIMVVIYENEIETTKRISIFDGFTAVRGGSNSVNAAFSYAGFNTIPTGPVRAKLLVAALEGDKSINGDRFQFRDVGGTFRTLSTPNTNPASNFFNGSITLNDQYLPNRSPASQNTLGFDADMFNLNNVNNSLLANNQTTADVRLTTSGDGYWVFLNAMSVEIIEPEVELVKTIEDINGNDIGGDDVTLGDEIWYNVAFRNKGNDDAVNTRIVDRLPKNVDLFETELTVPAGVTYTYDPPTIANQFRGELIFSIPDNLVEKGDPTYNIRMKVKVVENCNDLRDVCSNIIQNQAFADYTGEINGVTTTNTPSFSGLDNCNIGFEGPSNFLVDVDQCVYERDEVLCTETVDLTAGAGFLSYEWKNSNGDVIGTTQTITVSETGKYTVDKVAPVGCISSQEIINVISFITQPNPIIAFADETKTCPDDGSILSEIYLCGSSSTKLIDTNIINSNTLIWQKLDESSCTDNADEDCPNTNNACTWNTVKTGNDFIASEAGRFRLEIRAQGGCFKRYYFDVFQAELNPVVDKDDIVCGTPGSITINNVPDNYQFSLTNDISSFQDSNFFEITTAGSYTVYIRKEGGSATSCVYTLPTIDVLEKNIEVDLIPEPILCAGDNGTIRVQVNNVDGDYIYRLEKDGNLISETSPKADNDHSFTVSEEGIYTVKVIATNNCSFEGTVEISKPDPISITATNIKDISCTNGIIELTAVGGTPIYNYAVWSYNGVEMYASPNTIPIIEFFTDNTFEVEAGKEGVYEFVVIDDNNCSSISNPVTINLETPFTFAQNVQNVSCNGGSNGNFSVTPNQPLNGYTFSYSIDAGTTFQTENLFANLTAGTYEVLIRTEKGADVCDYTETVIISEPTPISGDATLTQDYTCTENGIITFTNVSGGNSPYSYSLDGINFFTDATFTGLENGTYTPVIKDANNCTLALADITIDVLPTAPTLTSNISYSCDGTATVEILPANSAFTYSLNGSTPTTSNIFTNLSEGNYSVDVNYGKNCLETINFAVLPNQGFSGFISNSTDATCFGDTNGSITITAENFGADFQYSLNNGSWVTSSSSPVTLANLGQGTYNIRIQSDSCTEDLGNVTISQPDEVLVSASVTSEISCTNGGATITPTATGGTVPYEFSIDGGTTWTNLFTNVAAGSYTIQARDANGCLASTNASISIDAPENLTFTTAVTNCFSGDNGQIQVDVTQGNGNYVFSLNNGPWQSPNAATPTTFTFTNLQANTYSVRVRDASDCEVEEQNIVINPQLTASIISTDISCNDGTISVTANGGDSNYVYAFVTSGTSVNASDFSNSNSTTISTAGDYDVYVRDKNGATDYCQFFETVTITQLPDLDITATATDPKCFGDFGSMELNFTGGLQPYSVSITGTNGFSDSFSNSYATDKSYFNLEADTYTITITDANGCTEQITSTITNPTELDATINPILPATCGSTDPNEYGIEFIPAATYAPFIIEYSIDNGTTWNTNPTFMGIVSGTVFTPMIRLLESNGITLRCQKVLDDFRMPFEVTNLVVSSLASGNCQDGFEVTLEAVDGVAPYEFAFNSTAAGNWVSSGSNTYVFQNLTPGLSYHFYVRDATGCIKEDTVDIYDNFTPSVDVTYNVTNEACPTSDTGEIIFSIDDSANPLTGTITWELFNTNDTVNPVRNGSQTGTGDITVSNLPAGDFYIVITNNLCSWGSRNATIKRGLPITADLNAVSDITCNQPGIVNITNVFGGFGNYEFTLKSTNFVNPIVTQNRTIEIPISNLVDDTISSTISISVSDGNQCSETLGDVILDVSGKPEIQAVVTDVCDLNKTITVTATNGTSPYFYSIDDGVSYQSSNIFTNVAVGNYTVKILDANGCESPSQAVEVLPSLTIEANITKNLDCSVNPEATIELNVLTGSTDYDVEVLDSANNPVIVRRNLASNPEALSISNAGNYEITVFDNITNCQKTINVEILPQEEPTFTYTVENSLCAGSNSGTIRLTNGNSALDYTYSILPNLGTFNVSTNSFENLEPGNYQITATADNFCSTSQINIAITEFGAISIPQPTVNQFLCASGNASENASISIDANLITGGSGTYTRFEFINNQGTATTTDDVVVQNNSNSTFVSNDKNGGNYTINVYDSRGCVGTVSAEISPFLELTDIFITTDKDVDCATGANITVTSNAEVNSANKTFFITDNNGFNETNTTGVFTNLVEGVYTIRVTNDDTGCFLETNYEVENPNNFEIDITKNNDLSCFNSNTGSVLIQFSSTTNYTGNYNYVVFDAITNQPTTITGNGVGVVDINNIPTGEYFVRANQIDTPFCTVDSPPFSIESPNAALDFTFTTTPITCTSANSGTLLVNPFGGWGNYEIRLATTGGTVIQDFGTNNSFSNLVAEDYVISVRDQFGCEVQQNVSFSNPTPIVATSITATSLLCTDDDNATITVSGVSGGQGNPVVYYYQLQKNGGVLSAKQQSNVFDNLSAGNYTVVISDDYACSTSYDITIDNPTEIDVNVNVTSTISCAVNTAQVTLSATGGSGNYMFSDDGVTFQNSNVFTVSAGEHQFFARDDSGCVSNVSEIVTIDPLVPLIATLDLTSALITCASESNAVIKTNASGGFGNYEYELLDEVDQVLVARQSDDTFADLSAGTYKVKVYSRDCEYTTESVTITEPAPITLTAPITVNNISCFGENDGSIIINATGGTGNLLYSIDQNKYVSDNVFTNLAAGVYDVVVQDENGCFVTETVTVSEPNQLEATAQITQQELCSGDANAAFQVNITGGTAPFSTSLNGAPFIENQLEFTNLQGGRTYVVFIEDANGCETFTTVTFDVPVSVSLSLSSEVSCTNYLSTITATVNSDVASDVQYSINNGALQTSNVFENLDSGTYTISAHHINGCVVSEDITISNPSALIIDDVATTDVACFGDANGTITVTASGGQGNLQYSLDGANYQTSNLFDILSSGNYQVFVRDELGCSVNRVDVTINQPTELQAQAINIQQESCLNQANGAFEVSIFGGTAPYNTSLNSGAFVENQTSFTNLQGGNYTVIVQDARGCETSVNVVLENGVNLNLQLASTVSCTNYLSTITATVNNDVASDVQYSINNGALQTSNIFENLDSGTYTISAHHINGCVVSEDILISNPSPIIIDDINTTNVSCFNGNNGIATVSASGGQGTLEFSLDGTTYQTNTTFDNLTAGTYQVFVRDELNCTIQSQQFTIDENPELQVSVANIQQSTCLEEETSPSFTIDILGGTAPYRTRLNNRAFVENQTNFDGLQGGKTYTVTVRDALDCETQIEVTLNTPIILDLTLEPEYSCDNTATIFALIDSQYDGRVTFTINGQNPQRDGIFTNIPAGQYVVEATHDNGCKESQTIVITETPPLEISVDTSTENLLIVNATGGESPYTYSVDNGDFGSENQFNIVETRFYTLSVKDSRGCIVSIQVLGEYIDIEIPNFFTPNGNGKHDTWYPKKVRDYHNIEVQIYDRYSRLLKTYRGVNNAWDGTYNNTPLPSGDYWYVIYYNQTPSVRKKLMGNFTLFR